MDTRGPVTAARLSSPHCRAAFTSHGRACCLGIASSFNTCKCTSDVFFFRTSISVCIRLIQYKTSPPFSFSPFPSQSQACISSATSPASTKPSSCNCFSASLAAVFLICPVIFFKFCTNNIRY